MHSRVRLFTMLAVAGVFAVCAVAQAKPGDGDGPPPHGHHGPPPGQPGNSGNPPGQQVRPPQGSCDSSGGNVDVQGPTGQSGASQVAHTQFGLMDSTADTNAPLAESATMMYFWYNSTFDYVLNAHALAVGTQWTLTYQPEPLPSQGVMCLGSGIVNGGGQLHIANSIELNSNLPPNLDPTADPSTQPPDALLALVPSADVDCSAGSMTNFEAGVYLWSDPRVRFVDTDLLPAAP